MKKTFAIIAAAILLIGIILAFTVRMVSTTIYNGEISLGIGLHVLIITLIISVSNCLLLGITKSVRKVIPRLVLHLVYEISGLFFAIATGYLSRANFFTEYYERMLSAPPSYSAEVTNTHWFPLLSVYAQDFQATSLLFFGAALTGFGAFILLLVFFLNKKAKTQPVIPAVAAAPVVSAPSYTPYEPPVYSTPVRKPVTPPSGTAPHGPTTPPTNTAQKPVPSFKKAGDL